MTAEQYDQSSFVVPETCPFGNRETCKVMGQCWQRMMTGSVYQTALDYTTSGNILAPDKRDDLRQILPTTTCEAAADIVADAQARLAQHP